MSCSILSISIFFILCKVDIIFNFTFEKAHVFNFNKKIYVLINHIS